MNGELERNRKRFRARPESTFIRLEVKGPSMEGLPREKEISHCKDYTMNKHTNNTRKTEERVYKQAMHLTRIKHTGMPHSL